MKSNNLFSIFISLSLATSAYSACEGPLANTLSLTDFFGVFVRVDEHSDANCPMRVQAAPIMQDMKERVPVEHSFVLTDADSGASLISLYNINQGGWYHFNSSDWGHTYTNNTLEGSLLRKRQVTTPFVKPWPIFASEVEAVRLSDDRLNAIVHYRTYSEQAKGAVRVNCVYRRVMPQ